ncbi:MAG: hypothetical protein ACXVLQ_02215 [Bacteriovorax sp.]
MKITSVGLIILLSFPMVHAETRKELQLRAFVLPSIKTSVKQLRMSSNQFLWIVSNHTNASHSSEEQKFEVEGLDQAGLESHINKVVTKDRTIQYEILINHIKFALPGSRPIFLKISAN